MRKLILIVICIGIVLLCANMTYADLTNGLVAYYPFSGNANDESGNINHGIVYGATLTTDRFGNVDSAYYFDGMNDYIYIKDHLSLHLNNFSICSWVYPNQITGKFGRITEKGASNSYWLYIWNDGRIVTGFYSGGYRNLWSINTISLSIFTFVCSTYDGSTLKIYINGQLDNYSSVTGTPNQNSQPLIIGAKHSGIQIDYFQGILDDMHIYNRSLSESEVHELYNIGSISDKLVQMIIDKVEISLENGKFEIKGYLDITNPVFESLMIDPQSRLLLELQTGGTEDNPEFGIVSEEKIQFITDEGKELKFGAE